MTQKKKAMPAWLPDPRIRTKKEIAEYDRKQAKFLATPITAKTEQKYTALIKQRRLYEGACELAWQQYFIFRDQHPDCEPLSKDDLAYAGQWTELPTKSKALTNAEKQARWRARRDAEMENLRNENKVLQGRIAKLETANAALRKHKTGR